MYGNSECWEIVDDVINHITMSSYFEINYIAFATLSKLFKHTETKRNIIKLRALKDDLNRNQKAIDDRKKRKQE